MRAPDGPRTAPITGITGGADGVEAAYDAVRALAGSYDEAGTRMRDWAGLGARVLANPDLVESGLLSPLTFAEAEASVLAATTGPDGILVESAGWEADAVLVRVTVATLEETDRLVHDAVDALDGLVGRSVGFALAAGTTVLLPALLAAAGGAAVTWPLLPAAVRDRLGADAGNTGRDLEQWLTDHPGIVQHGFNGGGGLLEGLWDGVTPLAPGGPLGVPLLAPDTESGAGLLARLYGDDGTPAVVATTDRLDGGSTQPRDVTGVLDQLREVAHLSTGADSPHNGTIAIQTIDDGRGDVRHIVYLPGTDDMLTLPWTQDDDVRDFATDLRLIAGADNTYQRGILDAMAQAQIGPHDPVLLVGHSQGGMEAAAILAQGSDYHVTNVVTAGSPTAQVDGFPDGSHVLSLENEGDVVPLTDGEPNPDSVEQVTVRFDDPGSGIVDNHSYAHYLAGAAAVDAATDPSVAEQLHSLRAHGFLADTDGAGGAGASVTSQVYRITRSP